MKTIPASEMPLNNDGSIYHLHLQPEQLAPNIILVGDPGRVPLVSGFFDSIEHKVQNRELVTHTGMLNGKRITAMSSGMGTDNIDIVLNALANVDLKTRTPKAERQSLNIIRVGTSGSFQPDYEVDTFCASEYGLGLDGLLNYYSVPDQMFEHDMERALDAHLKLPMGFAKPYVVRCSATLLNKVAFDMQKGITATAPGFFAPQGRELRLPLAYPQQNDLLQSFAFKGNKVTNMEMETSALYGLGRALGHRCLTVCVLVANRCTRKFSEDYHPHMERLVETVVNRLTA